MLKNNQIDSNLPLQFLDAVELIKTTKIRPEINFHSLKSPKNLAPYSFAVALDVIAPDSSLLDHKDAFGKMILLYNPEQKQAWEGKLRVVSLIQAEIEESIALDPLLSGVAQSWLTENLEIQQAKYTMLNGTITATNSAKFGNKSEGSSIYQIEIRCSWTPQEKELDKHLKALAGVLSIIASLPPEGVSDLNKYHALKYQ